MTFVLSGHLVQRIQNLLRLLGYFEQCYRLRIVCNTWILWTPPNRAPLLRSTPQQPLLLPAVHNLWSAATALLRISFYDLAISARTINALTIFRHNGFIFSNQHCLRRLSACCGLKWNRLLFSLFSLVKIITGPYQAATIITIRPSQWRILIFITG